MEIVYLLISKENNNTTYKGFISFNRLLKSINISKDKLNKNVLPVSIGNYTILRLEVINKI